MWPHQKNNKVNLQPGDVSLQTQRLITKLIKSFTYAFKS